MIETLIVGITLGVYAAFSPGPLFALLISQTIKHGFNEGAKVAFAPLITDLPIIIVSLLFLSIIAGYAKLLGIISIIGGLYLGYLAYKSFKTHDLIEELEFESPRSLKKAVTVNFLNPSPYIFWVTVGGPLIITAYSGNAISPVIFILSFYTFLVGTKIIISYLTGLSRNFIIGKTYTYMTKILGLLLLIFAFYLLVQGLMLLFNIVNVNHF